MPHLTRWLTWTAAATAGWLWVACGSGIYTYNRFADGGTADSEGVADTEPKPSPDARQLDGLGADLSDSQVPDAAGRDTSADMASLADGGNPSTTVTVDWQGGEVVAGDGRLVIPKDVLPRDSTGQITLTQLSADGTLPGYDGAVGPVFSISKDAIFERQARFEAKLTPEPSIPPAQLALAYIDPNAHLWIIMTDSTYDAKTGLISVVVNEFSSPWIVAPVLRCNSPDDCGEPTTCQGGVCQ